jgi:hypothetical protein
MAEDFDAWLERLLAWRVSVPPQDAPDEEWEAFRQRAVSLQAELAEVIDDEWAELDGGDVGGDGR